MRAETTLSPRERVLAWQQLGEDDDLPDRYELTQHGAVIMAPKPTNRHQRLCSEISAQLREQLGGEAIVEAAMLTKTAGVRVPDLVVEVLSPGNRRGEVAHEISAYLASGIPEVLFVALDGTLDFQRVDGTHSNSAFGARLDLPVDFFA